MQLMIRLIVIILISFTLSTTADARCRGKDLLRTAEPAFLAALQKATARHPFAQGLYWEVEKNGQTSWIIGTVHLDDYRVKRVPRFFAKKIRNARLLQVESTPKHAKPLAGAITRNLDKIIRIKGKRSQTYFTKTEWAQITKLLGKRGLRSKLVSLLSPAALAGIVSKPKCSTGAKSFLDKKIMETAGRGRVPVQSLDDIKYIEKFLFGNVKSDKFYVDKIRRALPLVKFGADYIETLIQMYLREETIKIWEYEMALARQVMKPSVARRLGADNFKLLISNRNRIWMPKIRAQLVKGNVVVAVGALHLPGKTGVLYQLQQRGYTVKRLKL